MPQLLRRLIQLYIGLICYGTSSAMMVRSRLGLDPWDVLHQGLARRLSLPLGLVVNLVGAVVLLGWIPLRQRPGIGTVSNVALLGTSLAAALPVLPTTNSTLARMAYLVGGVGLCAVATGLYLGAALGPGPRDGLMTGIAARFGRSIRLTRTGIELTALALGWLLGGTVGAGTVLFAVAIGPLTQLSLRCFSRPWAPTSREGSFGYIETAQSGGRSGRPPRRPRAVCSDRRGPVEPRC